MMNKMVYDMNVALLLNISPSIQIYMVEISLNILYETNQPRISKKKKINKK